MADKTRKTTPRKTPRKRRGDGRPGNPGYDRKLWAGKVHKRMAETGLVIKSCQLAGLGYDTYQGWKKEEGEEWIQQGEDAAMREYCESLEAEAHRRGVPGVPKPVIYKGELQYERDPNTGEKKLDSDGDPIPLVIREYSDRMLELLMKGRMPERYRENQRQAGDDIARVLVVPSTAPSVGDWMEEQQKRKANAA